MPASRRLQPCLYVQVPLTPLPLVFQAGDFQSETIRFGTERMPIDSWVRKRTYDAFREFVGSGMNYHLQVPRWQALGLLDGLA